MIKSDKKYSINIDPAILKTAGFDLESIKSTVEDIFSSKDSGEDKESFLNSIAPGLFFTLLRNKLGTLVAGLISLLMVVFKVDVEGIIESIWNSIKSIISSKGNISENEVKTIVDTSIKSNVQDAGEQDFNSFLKSKATISIKDAKIIKVAIEEHQKYGFSKTAGFLEKFNLFKNSKSKATSIFGSVLSTVLTTALASAGFMAVGKFIREKADIDSTKSKPTRSSQTHFPINPDYVDEQKNTKDRHWAFQIPPSKSEIENMLIEFANEVYLNLKDKSYLMKNSTAFQNLVDHIRSYNINNISGGITFIPKIYFSKRDLVDVFIDQVVNLDLRGVRAPISTSTPSTPISTSVPASSVPETTSTSPSKQPTTSAPPKPVKVTYPIVISQKWQKEMTPKQMQMLSKLTESEQKEVEKYLNSLSDWQLLQINFKSEEEKLKMFKDEVCKRSADACRRINS